MRRKIVDANYTMFEFYFIRNQTRYKQENYQKTAYTVENIEKIIACTLNNMVKINDELNDINYETTREKYFAKNQRKLMTKELRRKIMERDNYTCQKCGKYMPDEVGLQVDHIVAIKNGGKTVESNLQVLCDKCNLSKGAKEQS
ncbi:MAG: HNH endonuclease [Ruminococcus sp.]|nr:HNH endonuclease [Ruminococcus sp.]